MSTSLSSLSEQTIEKPCHFSLKLPSKPEIILRWQLTFQMGAWRQIMLTFFANFPVSCCRVSNRPFHTRLRHFLGVTFLWLVQYFLQDLDPCLAYKASSGYLLCFVLNISNEKRQEVKELTELKNRPRSMSRNLYILVITCRKYIRVDIFVLRLLISSFSSLLAYNVFVLVFCNFFIGNHKPILKESSL